MLIITVFSYFYLTYTLKIMDARTYTVPKIFISRKVRFSICCNYSVTRSVNHAVVLTHAVNAMLDRLGDLRSGIPRHYSKKPSRTVTTRCDEENQAFLTMDCDSLHSLSVNGSNSVVLGETICSRRFALRHKTANTSHITPLPVTEYRSCALIAAILGRTQKLHFAVNGWFMLRRSHIIIYTCLIHKTPPTTVGAL